jgi:tetratricopeptide (TPR) repeat protein
MPFLPPEALAEEDSIRAAAERAIALAKRGESRAALALALHARRNAQLMEMEQGEGEALNAAAIVHLIRGDPVAAVATAIDACGLARRSGDEVLLGHASVTLNMSACILGACDDAISRLRACAHEAALRGQPSVEIRARIAIGIMLGDRRRFDAAARQFEEALALTRACPGLTGPSRIVANRATQHRTRAVAGFARGYEARALHECAEAIRVAREACVMATQEGAVATEIDALGILGCVHKLRGDLVRARASLEESIALGRVARCPSATLWVLCELGQVDLDAGRCEEAERAYNEALRIAVALRPSRKIVQACSGLAAAAACRGDVEVAGGWRARAEYEAAEFGAASARTRRQLREFLALSP